MESAALHLAGCQTCAASLRVLESEAELLYSALAPEFDAVVPTERYNIALMRLLPNYKLSGPWRRSLPLQDGAIGWNHSRRWLV